MTKKLRILGTRGIPANHGGFETFAEHLAPYLVKHGWKVTIYCQEDGTGNIYNDEWRGVQRIHIPVSQEGAKGTIIFDWKSTLHAARSNDLILTLGYNTALFCIAYRLKGIKNIINMDGIEWRRDKWSFLERAWLYINERAGCWLGNHLIADHPEIKNHLATRVNDKKITMIPYGADEIKSADVTQLKQFGLEPDGYAIVIARPEPENSILEIVTAFSSCKQNKKLVVLGNFDKADPEYSKKVKNTASDEVLFPGAIYDKSVIQALRYYACLYIHGHTVGGTNPSLVEALGSGNAVLAHDNKFNRWVTDNKAAYFRDIQSCDEQLTQLLNDNAILRKMKAHSITRYSSKLTWSIILSSYEEILSEHLS